MGQESTTTRVESKADAAAETANWTALTTLSPSQLLALHGRVMAELRSRELIRTANNPTGDLAEYLFCKAFGWTRTGNSNANLDATGTDGLRYQIKGRRLTSLNASRQLSAIRDLQGGHFDFLAGVLFSERYEVLKAILIPHVLVQERAKFVQRTNSHKFFLRDDVWQFPNVRDVTKELQAVNF